MCDINLEYDDLFERLNIGKIDLFALFTFVHKLYIFCVRNIEHKKNK